MPPYDRVIANPPFHHGRAGEPDLGAAFIVAAGRILKPGGRLLMVANRQLPYEATLTATFRHCEKLAEDGVYKVIEAERPGLLRLPPPPPPAKGRRGALDPAAAPPPPAKGGRGGRR